MLKRSEDGRKAYVVVKGLPTITLRLKRPMPEGTPQNLMITRRLTGLVVSLTFAVAVEPLPESAESVGIDVGVRKRLTLSDGSQVSRRVVDRSREDRLRQGCPAVRREVTRGASEYVYCLV